METRKKYSAAFAHSTINRSFVHLFSRYSGKLRWHFVTGERMRRWWGSSFVTRLLCVSRNSTRHIPVLINKKRRRYRYDFINQIFVQILRGWIRSKYKSSTILRLKLSNDLFLVFFLNNISNQWIFQCQEYNTREREIE